MELLLQQFYKEIKLSSYNNDIQKWDNQINSQISHEYKYEIAQLLFEFCNNVSICNHTDTLLKPPNFDIVVPINTTLFFEKVNALWFCYSSNSNIILLCFTSTYTNSLFLVDVNYLHQDHDNSINNVYNGLKIHGGFLNFYQSFRNEILSLINKYHNDKTQLIVSGFSLGGAISTLATLDLYNYNYNKNIVHFSFASPRIFNIIGANYYDSLSIPSYRIYNDSDIVPSLPFPLMISSINSLIIQDFMHVNKSIPFNDNMNNYYDNHILAYSKYFKLK